LLLTRLFQPPIQVKQKIPNLGSLTCSTTTASLAAAAIPILSGSIYHPTEADLSRRKFDGPPKFPEKPQQTPTQRILSPQPSHPILNMPKKSGMMYIIVITVLL